MSTTSPNNDPQPLSWISDPSRFLADLLEYSPVAYCVYAADGRYLFVNRAYKSLFGEQSLPKHHAFEEPSQPELVLLIRSAIAGRPIRLPTLWNPPAMSDRRRKAVEATAFPVKDAAGAVAQVVLCFKDVTAESELRATTEALELSEQRFRATFEQAAVGIAHVAPDGSWLRVNKRLCDIVGYSALELRALTFQDITHPDDLEADLHLVTKVLAGELRTYSMDKRYLRKDGSLVWIELTVSLVRGGDGSPLYFISVIRDISSRRAAEERLSRATAELELEVAERRKVEVALRNNEESLATTLDSIGDAVIATDTAGLVTRMNPIAESLTGWRLEDARGLPLERVFRILDIDTRVEAENPVRRVLEHGRIVGLANHTVLIARDGAERPIADSASPIRDARGALHGVVLVFRDQSREYEAERVLRESEATKSAVMKAALDCIVTADQSGAITEFNPAAERTFGYTRAEIVGMPLITLIPPSLRERHQAGFESYLRTGRGAVLGKRIEIVALRADGAEFPVELAVVPTQSQGRLFFTAYIRDLSERQRTEQALRGSEARFKRLADSGIVGVVIADLLGNVLEANPAFLEMLGFSAEEVSAGVVRWDEITPGEWADADARAVAELLETGVAPPYEKEYLCKDGTRKPVLLCVAMLEPPQCIAMVVDLTPQRQAELGRAKAWEVAQRESLDRAKAELALLRTEQQLRHSQKLEAIGLLAGSIAHDFNNLLSIVQGYSEMLLEDMPAADPMREEVSEISGAAARASDLTRQLLAFGRRQVLEPRCVDLNAIVDGMTRMLSRVISEDIELDVVLPAALGPVFVDPSQIEQVLVNLVVNARDAMPRGGKVTIETARVTVDLPATRYLDLNPGIYIVLTVSDTGVGMDPETQSRAFEPFFTTKEPGKGTGLGLSTVYGIVKQSGGSILLNSEIEKGTSFKIYLPQAEGRLSETPREARPRSSAVGQETILLVEDDGQVRALAFAILRRHGYHVLEAASGGDALLICEQFLGSIDLLLTDVVMPRMSGRDLWERLKVLRPSLRVLFMSGYTDDAILRHGLRTSELSLVSKPLTPSKLLDKLREALQH